LVCTVALAACARVAGPSSLPSEAANVGAAQGGYKVLYSFGQRGKFDDGRGPAANLIAVRGTLYGTTQYGGTTNAKCDLGCGTVFALTATGKERVIYRFSGGSDGAQPAGGLVEVDGTLFGTTSAGGMGRGTIFKVSADGKSERTLYRFKGAPDGADPVASLVSVNGSLFGTTEYGGKITALCSAGCGTIFKVSRSGAESVIYRFQGVTDGVEPVARLTPLGGQLYGTTQYGGAKSAFCAKGCGTLFRLGRRGVKTIIHRFKYSLARADGAYPAAAPTVIGVELYGTTLGGGHLGEGTVFEANPKSGAEKVLHSFGCCTTSTDGEYPTARLVRDASALYGTTREGGRDDGGTVFSVTSSGGERVLHDFTGKPDGAQPQAGMNFVAGELYGTTAAGGSASGGTVFEIKP
jgi:uncharacterized repeat protein (TIGR03803 family)